MKFVLNDEATRDKQMLLQESLKEIQLIRTDRSATDLEVVAADSDRNFVDILDKVENNKSGPSASVLDDYWGDFDDQQESSVSDSTSDEAVCLKEFDLYFKEPLQPRVTPQLDSTA